MKCRSTGVEIPRIITFGQQPLGNGFLNSPDIEDEYFFEMAVAVNPDIALLQLEIQPDPRQMFHENYAFFSRTSNFMVNHFSETADEIVEILKDEFPEDGHQFVVEIGSNDGVMLENIVNKGVDCLGVEPSENVAKISNQYGVETISEFFSADLSAKIVESHKNANVIYAANVFCHIPEINDLAEACSNLLKDNGYLIFEDPYLGDVIEKASYDQVYDEHVYLFSCNAIKSIFAKYGLKLVNCKHLNTHGGSMRYYLKKNMTSKESLNLAEQLNHEENLGMLSTKAYETFAQKCEITRVGFKKRLIKAKEDGLRVLGYGATSKSTTILNYCDVGPDLIDFITDTTPTKIGKYTPGMHIPVKSYDHFEPHPDLAVLFAWNHKKEILLKESSYNGEWMTHLYEEYE
mgnify:CR=1 FL=1